MNVIRITLIAVLLLSTLLFAGCAPFHHGPRHCGSPCAMAEGQKPCQQQEDCVKAGCDKPCCAKMKAAETPAQ